MTNQDLFRLFPERPKQNRARPPRRKTKPEPEPSSTVEASEIESAFRNVLEEATYGTSRYGQSIYGRSIDEETAGEAEDAGDDDHRAEVSFAELEAPDPPPAAMTIRLSAERRAQAVARIEEVIADLQENEWNESERAHVDQAVIALKWTRSILTLEWDSLPPSVASERERDLADIRDILEKVRDWFLRKSDNAATGVIVFAINRILEVIT